MSDQLPENIRAWGHYDIYETQDSYQVKKHTVEPGKRNSYQRHQRRSEHWIVVEGTCRATIDDEFVNAKPGDVISVPVGAKHRWENVGTEPLVIIEVQVGDYFGEDDIERFEDDYGREGTTTPH
ncbi:phosphomannose isomerase type II C-terminal cupin domain [Candidatus Uhrbacteria bacterium]|jgi:mannose-6-phosphate isomerase|nr:phosphomannose isomerase type II C-terminal cupin domain [Candidatus Uhrbacteria bacterium]